MQIPADRRLQRAQTFDEIAELYDQGRREPPGWLYDTLFSSSGLDPALTRTLEIGCGTGKSTLPLARRGCHVVALEMGTNLARLARQHLAAFPKVQVINARFEDWSAPEPFDLALAITSWHWLDPIGVGRLPWPPLPPESIADARAEIEQTGLFEDVRVIRQLWTEEFTADEHVALMRTASDHQLMEPVKRERLFDQMRHLIQARPAGRIRKHNLTLLHLARRLP